MAGQIWRESEERGCRDHDKIEKPGLTKKGELTCKVHHLSMHYQRVQLHLTGLIIKR